MDTFEIKHNFFYQHLDQVSVIIKRDTEDKKGK